MKMTNIFIKPMLFGVFLAGLFACSQEEQVATPSQQIQSNEAMVEEAFPGRKGVVQQGVLFGEPIDFENIDGHYVFQGDILLTEEQLSDADPNARKQSTGRTLISVKWPSKIVYYTIDPALPSQSRVTNAINHWQTNTSIRFVKRTNQANYVTFRPGSGCSSSVGMVGGQQFINVATSCSTGNTIHEIGHALGLWHEHTRKDRNNYVKIHTDNISYGKEHNFQTYYERGLDGFDNGSLDFGSIMMYSSYSFSSNGLPTITKRDGSTFTVQRTGLSTGDKRGVAYMYP